MYIQHVIHLWMSWDTSSVKLHCPNLQGITSYLSLLSQTKPWRIFLVCYQLFITELQHPNHNNMTNLMVQILPEWKKTLTPCICIFIFLCQHSPICLAQRKYELVITVIPTFPPSSITNHVSCGHPCKYRKHIKCYIFAEEMPFMLNTWCANCYKHRLNVNYLHMV